MLNLFQHLTFIHVTDSEINSEWQTNKEALRQAQYYTSTTVRHCERSEAIC